MWDVLSTGWGNDELEYYTDAASNVIVTTLEGEGVLQITALKGAAGDAHLYTSARLVTQGLHSVTPKNGSAGIRVAVRALLPPGLLPAGPCTRSSLLCSII